MKNGVTEAFREIAGGNESAFQFCLTYWAFAHTIDDLVDRDKAVTPSDAARNILSFIENVAVNEFFQVHRAAILGSIRSAVFLWVASEEWKARESLRDKMIAEVLKSGYQDTIFLVASLAKDLPHALAMQSKYRDYDFG